MNGMGGHMTKICSKCKCEKNIEDFHKDLSRKDGHSYICKQCNNERSKTYYKTNIVKCRKQKRDYAKSTEGKIIRCKYIEQTKNIIAERVKTYRVRNRKKYRCRWRFKKALKAGKIMRPEKCDGCNKKCKPDGHHPDYNYPLKVEWLCKQCHGQRHRKDK